MPKAIVPVIPTPHGPQFDQLLTEKETAKALRISHSGLRKLRARGAAPRHLRLAGKMVRYRKSDILDWLQASAS